MVEFRNFSKTKNFGTVELTGTDYENDSIGGVLRKWTFLKNGHKYYVKTFSKSLSGFDCYECENECFAYNLFQLLGLPSVKYTLDEINYRGVIYKVCVSKDYAHNCTQDCIYECIPGIDAVKGIERYNLIISYLPSIKGQLDQIIIGDFIINNRDRHLHNFELVTDDSGKLSLPCYDNGNSLYYDVRDKSLKLFYNLSWSSCPSKPFYSSWGNQLSIIDLTKYSLNKVYPEEIKLLLNKYYSKKRSELLLKLILTRMQVLEDKGVNFL